MSRRWPSMQHRPGAAAVVGDDQASRIYVGAKHKASADVGIHRAGEPPRVRDRRRDAGDDPAIGPRSEIHGIIVQLPLPPHVHELEVQRTMAPEKDVDGLHPWNVGMVVRGEATFQPATPYGIVELLLRSGIRLEGAEVVVVGYGDRRAPLSIMLAQDSIRGNATVTITHAKTEQLAEHTRRAGILVAGGRAPADHRRHGQARRDRDRRRCASHRRRPRRRRELRRGGGGRRRDHPRARRRGR